MPSKYPIKQVLKFKKYDPPVIVDNNGVEMEAAVGVVIKEVVKDFRGEICILSRKETPIPGKTIAEVRAEMVGARATRVEIHKNVTDEHAAELADMDEQLADIDTL